MRSGSGVEPRNDGVIRHQPFAVTLVAVVASRQFPESRNQQTLLILGIGEAALVRVVVVRVVEVQLVARDVHADDAAEAAKIELSSMREAEVMLPFLASDESGPKHLEASISRTRFERAVGPLIDRALLCCRQALDDAGISTHINNKPRVDRLAMVVKMRVSAQGEIEDKAYEFGFSDNQIVGYFLSGKFRFNVTGIVNASLYADEPLNNIFVYGNTS